MNPTLVDKALAQTYKMGHAYAAVPLPWFLSWGEWGMERGGVGIPVATMCQRIEWAEDEVVDDEGNVLICLLEKDHEGECGYTRNSQ